MSCENWEKIVKNNLNRETIEPISFLGDLINVEYLWIESSTTYFPKVMLDLSFDMMSTV